MKLVNITLHNIGLYEDQTIRFPHEGKNVLLFWGNNGAGKTTLLNSIKIGLLGASAFENYQRYCAFVTERLISSRCKSDCLDAGVGISFEIVKNGKATVYHMERSWTMDDDSLEEDVNVYAEGEKLGFLQGEAIQNEIRSILSPSLMDVLIFDGENAISLLRNDQMPSLVRNIISSIFGMDVYSRMAKDLQLSLKDLSTTVSEEGTAHYVDVSSRYKQTLARYKGYKKIREENLERKKKAKNSLIAALKRISKQLGIETGQIDSLEADLDSMKERQKKVQNDFRYVMEEILPLMVLKPRLLNLQRAAEKEKPYSVLESIRHVALYFKEDEDSIELLRSLERRVSIPEDNFNLIGMPKEDVERLDRVLGVLEGCSKERLLSFVEERNSVFDLVKGKIEVLGKLSGKEAKESLEEIRVLSEELESISLESQRIDEQFKEAEEERDFAKKEYDESKKAILEQKKSSNAYVEMIKYTNAIEDFVESTTASICAELNDAICGSLREIGYRNCSIKEVAIDPNTFSVSLFEEGHRPIAFSVFSAGEKQILLGLIIKESLRLSGMDGFFLFDTPVGRLDMGNRTIFTNEVIMQVANQVMIFATDSDYGEADYQMIRDRVASEYVLSRNLEDKILVKEDSIYGTGAEYDC